MSHRIVYLLILLLASCSKNGKKSESSDAASEMGDLKPENIRAGVTIAGVTGTLEVQDLENLTPGNIRAGVTIAGVTGAYPSEDHPMTDASSAADLKASNFAQSIHDSTPFEYWDSKGERHNGAGDADLVSGNIGTGVEIFGVNGTLTNPQSCNGDGQTDCLTSASFPSTNTSAYSAWDVRKGKTIGGVSGAIVFNKNMADTATYNRTAGTGALAGLDIYDTIDDFNAGGAFPTMSPSSFEQVSLANWQRDATSDTGTGGGTASDGICNGTEDCVYKDRTSGSFWARSDGTSRTMETTITYCENLSYGGYTDWRMPTQKELLQAYIDGIWGMKDATKLNLGYDAMASTRYSNTPANFLVCLAVGCVVEILGSNPPLCVR